MRIKTEQEFIDEFGEDFAETIDGGWNNEMEYLFGKTINNDLLNSGEVDGWVLTSAMVIDTESNTVTAPTHYITGEIECIDAIRSALTEEEFRGYCKGNVLKYTWREKLKGGDEDLKKAKQYIEFMEVKR